MREYMYVVMFFYGVVACAALSALTLFAVPKVGIAPAAGAIFAAGILFGGWTSLRFGKKLLRGGDFLKYKGAIELAIYDDLLGILKRYKKETAIEKIEEWRDEAKEEAEIEVSSNLED